MDRLLKSYIPIYILIIGIQGFPIILQVLSYFILTKSEFANIRSIESFIAISLMYVVWGAPTLAIKLAALNKKYIYSLALKLVTIPLIIITISAPIYFVANSLYFYLHSNLDILLVTIFLVFASSNRIFSALIQGSASANIFVTRITASYLICLSIFLFSIYHFKNAWWLYCRITCELIFVIFFLNGLHRFENRTENKDKASSEQLIVLLKNGFAINSALLVRSIIDNMPLLILSKYSLTHNEVANFGAATLYLTFPALVCGIYSQKKMPEIIQANEKRYLNKVDLFKIRKTFLALGVSITIVFIVILFIADVFIKNLLIGVVPAMLLALLMPIKQLSLFYGMLFIANDKFKATVIQNLIELSALIISLLLIGKSTTSHIIIAIYIASIIGLLYCFIFGNRSIV